MFIAKRQPSSRYLLAGSRDTANESRDDGSRWHLVIPLLVSGIYAEIPRMNRGMTVRGGMMISSSSRCLLADEIPRRYDGSWRYDEGNLTCISYIKLKMLIILNFFTKL
ncbi:hypothetical protein ACJZL1_03515 [Wolbachia endosymbiont of Rhagoletis indifferens]|uniref:hypothetical protein n=1 Tax=Wolbachia endosymbiont of Rhagoletis indifferens TaxID=3383250 RepID=UPI003AF38E15